MTVAQAPLAVIPKLKWSLLNSWLLPPTIHYSSPRIILSSDQERPEMGWGGGTNSPSYLTTEPSRNLKGSAPYKNQPPDVGLLDREGLLCARSGFRRPLTCTYEMLVASTHPFPMLTIEGGPRNCLNSPWRGLWMLVWGTWSWPDFPSLTCLHSREQQAQGKKILKALFPRALMVLDDN